MVLQTRGIFGSPMQPDRGLMSPGLGAPVQGAVQQPQKPKRDKTRHIAGILADVLAGLNGQGPVYAPMMQRRREMEWREQQAELERERDNRDWFDREAWKMANSEPDKPDVFTQMMIGAGIDPDSPQAQALYRKRAQSMAEPMQFIPGEYGGGQFMPRGGPTGGLQFGMEPGHSEDGYTYLGGDPADPNSWREGGPEQQAPGMFP